MNSQLYYTTDPSQECAQGEDSWPLSVRNRLWPLPQPYERTGEDDVPCQLRNRLQKVSELAKSSPSAMRISATWLQDVNLAATKLIDSLVLTSSCYGDFVKGLHLGIESVPAISGLALATSKGNPWEVYVERYGLKSTLKDTFRLSRTTLPTGSTLLLSVEGDGESDEEWLVIDVKIKAPRTEVFGLFNRFIDEWTESTPVAEQRRIRFTYSAG